MKVQKVKSVIYLSGGFKSGWQTQVKHLLSAYELLDPSTHRLEDPKEYTKWDLDALDRCDIVLANIEESNPGGYSLALEIGYAKALAKKIVLVDQIKDPQKNRYFEMVKQVSDITFNDLDQALQYLLVTN